MKTRSARTLALATLAAVLPAVAGALDLTGRLGLGYVRSELDPPEGPSSSSPQLDVDLGLDARGIVVSPDVVDWKLGGAYRRTSVEVDGRRSSLQERFLYDGRATLFGSSRSLATVVLGGSRSQYDFSSSLTLDAFGRSTVDSANATVTVRPSTIVPVVAGYAWRRLEEDVPGFALHERTTHAFNASMGAGSAGHNFSASYAGELNDGTLQTDRYGLHSVSIRAGASLPGGAELVIDERYHRLEPEALAVGTVAQDNNVFRAAARDRGTYGDRHVLEYLYGHVLTEAPAVPLAETVRNSLRYEGDHLLTRPTFFARWTADLSLSQSRLGATETSSSGETLGLQLWWRRLEASRTYEVFGGPLVGFLQTDAPSEDDFGYGASATGRLSLPWAGQTARLSYELGYASDLFASSGWTLRQSLSASLDGRLATGRYTALLRAGAFRSSSPLFGDGATRLVEAYSILSFRRLDLELRGLVEDGVSGATPADFAGDGLFIPSPYDTSNRQLALRGTARIWSGLSARAHFRFGSAVRPGQPSLEQTEVIGGLDYHYAAFSIGVEDRVSWVEQPGGTATSNTFLVRVYRRLDWHF